jgi:hypothetical protein
LPFPRNSTRIHHPSPGPTRQNKEKERHKNGLEHAHFCQKSGAILFDLPSLHSQSTTFVQTFPYHQHWILLDTNTVVKATISFAILYLDTFAKTSSATPTLRDPATFYTHTHDKTTRASTHRQHVPRRLPAHPLPRSPHPTRLGVTKSCLCHYRKQTHTSTSSISTTYNDTRSVVCTVQFIPWIFDIAFNYTSAFTWTTAECKDGLVCAVA